MNISFTINVIIVISVAQGRLAHIKINNKKIMHTFFSVHNLDNLSQVSAFLVSK